jgi:2-polyprenyl-3-methyl-5-hydroxy-6-metoxy-1,4-benzoquinol methylase
LGCGSGFLLRKLQHYLPEYEYYGIDHHPEIVEFARSQSSKEIKFQKVDALEYVRSLDDRQYHIVICSLFLHHFSDEQIIELFNIIKQKRAYLVVNDLQRSRWAYLLFQLYGLITALSSVSISDGLLSIKKGFRRLELLDYAELSGTTIHRLKLKPLFRWHMEVSA